MGINIKYLRGFNEGQSLSFESFTRLKIGRHPHSDIPFHPQLDIRASGNHAELRRTESGVILTDLNSSNGTFVNGERITETLLFNGDIVECGKSGPQFLYQVDGDDADPHYPDADTAAILETDKKEVVGEQTLQMMIRKAVHKAKNDGNSRFGSTTVFVRELVGQAVGHASRKIKIAILLLASVMGISIIGLIYQNNALKETLSITLKNHRQELNQLENRFNDALAESRQRSEMLRQQLAAAKTNSSTSKAQLEALQDLLSEEQRRSEDLAKAIRANNDRLASLNTLPDASIQAIRSFQPVARDNAPAIYMVCGYDPATQKTISIGTAFVVKSKGLLLTNGHVAGEISRLKKEFGEKYTAVVVQNGRPKRKFTVTEVVTHPEFDTAKTYTPDVASLTVDTGGKSLKTVQLASTADCQDLEPGYEVAVMGFPEVTMDPGKPLATLSRGVIGRMIDNRYIQHDCQTSGGNSGSPILNLQGKVVGIHYGGVGNVHVFVPTVALDSSAQPIINPDGSPKMTLGKRRIKQAIGVNLGYRIDLLEAFLRQVSPGIDFHR